MPALRWLATAVVLGIVGGFAWRVLAHPPVIAVTRTGLSTSEAQATRQFTNLVVLLGIGAVMCVVWAGIMGFVRHDLGWRLVPGVAAVSALAAVIAGQSGVAWSKWAVEIPKHPTPGDHIVGPLTLDTWTVPVAWAACGVAGLLVATWLRPARR